MAKGAQDGGPDVPGPRCGSRTPREFPVRTSRVFITKFQWAYLVAASSAVLRRRDAPRPPRAHREAERGGERGDQRPGSEESVADQPSAERRCHDLRDRAERLREAEDDSLLPASAQRDTRLVSVGRRTPWPKAARVVEMTSVWTSEVPARTR